MRSNMTRLSVALPFLCFILIKASPIPPIRNQGATHDQQPATLSQSQTSWSRQDVFTLISVFLAVAAILTAVLVTAPKLRRWLCKPLESKLNLNPKTCAAVFTAARVPRYTQPSCTSTSLLF
jgi:hypothetical protein